MSSNARNERSRGISMPLRRMAASAPVVMTLSAVNSAVGGTDPLAEEDVGHDRDEDDRPADDRSPGDAARMNS